jgi:large conductance mechanosensitive channel
MNQGIIKEFRDFLMRGNIIELAIAFIMGLAFVPVVTSFVDGIIMPFFAAIFDEPNFNNVGFDVNDSRVQIGLFITAIVNFVLIAGAVFFLIVKPMDMIKERMRRGEEAPPPPAEDIALLTEIRDLLRQQNR